MGLLPTGTIQHSPPNLELHFFLCSWPHVIIHLSLYAYWTPDPLQSKLISLPTNNPWLASLSCLPRTSESIFHKDSKFTAHSVCPHSLPTTRNPRAQTSWFFLLFSGWQMAGQSPVTCLSFHHSLMKTMGMASAWNTHIHPLADCQSHPQGPAPTFLSPQIPLPLSVPLNLQDPDHIPLPSRLHITSFHLKISVVSFPLFLSSGLCRRRTPSSF